ncbi:hypothetical protein QYE76_005656 [Lolium multiflorum]|uniref:Gag-pol polyprotein n=1 Tax=Lolium multiflorum TaxID=4521 RepID=A0AAD8RT44_LOLMU|nr:hypothetical protein QYE76_005656 [Lolium multiflorum]
MPKSGCCFCFRNPTKEIFSELDEINAQGPILPRSFQKTKWGHGATTRQGGVAWALPRGLLCGFHVGAGIPGVAPHYIPPPSTFDVLLDSYWFDKPWFLGKLVYASHLPLGVPNARGGGRPHQSHCGRTPHSGRPPPPLPNPSRPLSSTSPATLSEAPPEFSIATATTPSCCRIQGGATTSAARWNGEKDVVFINTERVTEYGDMASPINFNQFLEKEKLKSNGSNFTDWFRHVRIFLNGGNLQYVLDAPLGDPPAETETDEVKNVYATRKTRYSQVQCAILCSLEADLQKRFEHHDPHELVNELKTIFETHAAVECYEASKHFFSCMMEEGSSVSEHMLAMTGHAKKLSDLGIVIPNRLGINRVLQSLPPSYKNFVMNYNMQNMNKELPELFSMLKSAEIEIKKEHQVLMVNKTTSFKKQGKSKGKFKKGGKKAATPPVKPKTGPKPDAECYYCKEKGHWKRNCSKYLADLKSGLVKKKKEGISDIHVIDVYLTGSRTSTWVFDTGLVAHICNSKQELKNKRRLLKDEVTMRVGNGSKVDVIAVGTLPLHLPSGLVLSLNNCYFVPALSMNIISGSCLMQDGYSFKSENNGCSIFMNNIFYGRAPEKNGLFLLDLDSSDTHIHNIDAKRIKLNDNSTYMWHCRLGHIGVKRMKKLHTDGLLESLDFESLDRCEACLMGKMTKTPFSGIMERATDLLEIIHTDVCGPMSVASRGGYRYVLTFTDDLSRYGYIYFMKHKSETFEKFKEFQSEVENQRNKKIKFLRSDRGGEYLSYEFGMHLKKCGILSQLTPPGTPQRNGVSEHRNRTLLDMVRSMMSLTDLPLSFWSYALETAAFTLNRAPSKSVETTPYELWFNKKPKLSFLKVWGCEAYVKKLQPDKLEPKAEKCVFIGYPKETIGYTFYHRSEGKIFVAKNGTFLEKEFLTKEVTGRKVELDEIEESLLVDQSSAVPEDVPVPPTPATEEANDNDHETSNEIATEPRRSTRERATPDWYDPCLNVMIVDNNDEDPATYEEAMMSPDSNKWQEAMKSEMGSMYDNKVWTLVDLPDSRKAVENKWIFKRKTDADGNITVYKARLVAKGFRQIQGVDYDETFSPVAKLKSVRILLAIAAFFDYEIWQMDVKTAFLNGDIEEELYMVQPKGFVDPKNADKVCKLQRSIYGLKQASRSWNRRFDKVIKDFGFIQCHGEACIYKKVSGSSVAFLILYVDDILLIGNDIELLSSVKGYLNNSFSMKDLGEASYILGIKIYRDRSRRLIGLSQSTYLDKILKKFRMDESKKGFLPMLPGKVLSKTQGPATAEERERMSQIPYASAVGSIMYAMLCTRPDIAHAVSLTSRYQSDPGMEHWTAVKNILKYLKRTKDMFLCYGGDQELVVTSYTDASWNTDPDDSKSQSGYVFILNGAAVSWASSKQCTVAKSSTESEYIAASEASSEAVWMKRFIVELGVVPSALDPLVIYCDNMGAIANAQEPRSHKRLKHIKLRYHSIREYIEDGEVKICKVHTDLNVADPLTKALPRAKHDQHQNAMGVSCYMEDNHEDGAIDLGASPTMMEIMPVDDGDHFLEKEKLKSNGSNFTDWFRHVRIFLNGGNLQYVLDAPLGDPPAETETDEVKNVYATRKTRYSQVQCAILCSLEADLQKRFEHHDPHELINELKTIFETHAAVECYEASKHFFSCMMEEGSSVSEHMLAMTGHAKKLSDLGIVIPNRLGINRVLQSLPPSYKNFVMNYNMQNMNKELPELFSMLKSAEIEIKKEHQVLMVNKTTSFKKQGKSKGKFKKGGKKAATPPVKPKTGPKPDAECYYCKEKGHWKRNCSKYLADLKSGLVKKKKEEFLTKEVTGRKVELDEIEESLLVDQSSAVPEDVPVPPTPATEEANDNDHETSNETATEPRRSTRERATPDWYDPCLNVMIVDNNDEDPATYEEAMMSPDSNKWQEAMKSEMGSMYDNKVWTLVDLPDSRKAVENKWIFKRKTDADGNITVYKARLVAKGFRQIQGVDYDETFSPVAKLKSVRILLAIAAFFDYEIWQMDVKTAFLNGDIEEELYMVQPKGFVDPKNADKVCKLQRSIYGLKQASRSWNRRFDKVIKDFGFIQCHGEACIYKKVSGSSVAFLILYVDDILLIGNDIELLSSVKGYLNNSFSMKDLGEASYILGIKIYRDRSRRLIGLSQSTYLDKILKKFRMDESKKGFLPMLPGKVLSKTQGPATAEERERMSQIPYASAVGSIMYAMLCTRPDIAHAVSLTSRYQSDPGMEHWTAVKNILKYLKRTKDMFLCYGGDQELVVTSYTDASWNTDPDDSKSQSGYVFILNGAAVSWASSKQCTVAKSSTESEYIAASEASSEAVWMKRFIIELGVVPSALDPLVIYCDNMGAIANAQEPRSHKRLKHIKLRYHSIREYIEDGEVKICKVHTDLNVADPLTKALPRAKHDQHQNAMGVRYLTM